MRRLIFLIAFFSSQREQVHIYQTPTSSPVLFSCSAISLVYDRTLTLEWLFPSSSFPCSESIPLWILLIIVIIIEIALLRHNKAHKYVYVCNNFEPLPSFRQISEKWQGRKSNGILTVFVEMDIKMKSIYTPHELKPAAWSSFLLSIRDFKLKRCQTRRKRRRERYLFCI